MTSRKTSFSIVTESGHIKATEKLRIFNSIALKLFKGPYVIYELGSLSQYNVWPRTGRPGFDPRQSQSTFLLASVPRPALRPTQPPVQWEQGILSWGKARPGRDTDHSLPSSADVKYE
jgi:hypothetical protein